MGSFSKQSKSLLKILKFFDRAIMSSKVQLRVHVIHSLFPVTLVPSPVAVVQVDLFPILKVVFLFSCQYTFSDVFSPGQVRRAAYRCF